MSRVNTTERAENIKSRQDIVLGVCLAVIAGFLVNIFSSIFYDTIISKTLTVGDVSQVTLSMLLVLLIIFEAFLEFLIYDVRQGQSSNIDTRFWGRFLDFAHEQHWINKATKSMMRMLWAGVKFLFWIIILVSFITSEEYLVLTVFVSATLAYQLIRRGIFNNILKKNKP